MDESPYNRNKRGWLPNQPSAIHFFKEIMTKDSLHCNLIRNNQLQKSISIPWTYTA